MINAAITITNRLPTDTGFAVRMDDCSYSQVFVPSHIVRAADLEINHTYDVVLIDNTENQTVPWRVAQMSAAPTKSPAPAPEKTAAPPAALIDDQIMALLEASIYMTTGEIATALDASSTMVRDRLLALFNQNRIVRADVHARPNLRRATMCLWAIDIDAFIACEDDH